MLKLEKMELYGFKSFNERTHIQFDRGITAVVGPNGCGKSNILDAMAWVLGEQSAKTLRGAAMADLIFNGSQSRRPLTMAEVTLRLRATNGDLPDGRPDVAVTRRLFRSGESEYMLNGEVCRLKDINDLLYGSGLGVKGYSFIEQGRIGAILSAKPLERRALIEEAAGITRFRVKKRQAELKLEQAQLNLVRVQDIVAEVDKQMGTLKRQAAKARRFERVRDDLRSTLRELYAREFEILGERAVDSAERYTTEATRRARLVESVDEAEAAVDAFRMQIEKRESEVRSSAERLHEAELDVDRNRNLIVGGRERHEELERRGREVTDALAACRARHDELVAERAALEQQRQAAQERLDGASSVLGERRRSKQELDQSLEEAERQLESARAELVASVQIAVECGHREQGCERELEQLDQRSGVVLEEQTRLERICAEAEAAVVSARKALATQEAIVAELGETVKSCFEEVQQAGLNLDEARGALDSARERVHTHQERSRALERVIKMAEDAGEATASAVGRLGERAGGVLADYVRAEPSVELAVGAALEPVLGALVLTEPELAGELLGHATADGSGVLRLLLVDGPVSDVPHPDARAASGDPGVRGLLRDFVTLREPVAQSVALVLQSTLLVESIDDALRLRQTFPDLSFVTAAGEVVHGDGLLRAGGRLGPGLLAARREQRELERGLESARAEVAAAEQDLAVLDETSDACDVAAREAVRTLHEAEKVSVDLRHRFATAEVEQRQASERVRAVIAEREALVVRLEQAQQTLARTSRERVEAEAARGRVEGSIESHRQGLAKTRDMVEGAAKELLLSESEFARAEEVAKATEAQLVRLTAGVAERAREAEALDGDRRAALDRGAALVREIEGAEEALTGLLAEVAALRDRLQTEEAASSKARHDLQGRETELKDIRHDAELQRERVQAIEIEKTRIEGDLERLRERCREDLECALEELAAKASEELERASQRTAFDDELDAEDDGDDKDAASPVAEAEAAAADAAGSDPEEPVTGPDESSSANAAETARESVVSPLASLALDDLRARAENLKHKIGKLGPVNELAVREYQELRERYDFLSTQAQDLVASIDSLVATINRINRTTRERFRQTYDEVNRNFQETFARVFRGGRAELRLTDEDNLLETGIDIVAQPPGKRLQNILLLSGGEKALTAISLLFALFQYKPSPFCILDEVDAPLDEKNIDRFVELVRGLGHGTQFILITHSTRTMKVADTLYGVTMEEPGCSRVVSVDLQEAV